MSERTRQWLIVAERLLAVLGALVTAALGANQLDLPGRAIAPALLEQLVEPVRLPADPVVKPFVSCWKAPPLLERAPLLLILQPPCASLPETQNRPLLVRS